MSDPIRLILASGSAARKHMLDAACLVFEVIPADVDEDTIRSMMVTESDCVESADVAAALAMEKALAVSQLHPGALVIGSDQVLGLGRPAADCDVQTLLHERDNLLLAHALTPSPT